MRDLEFGCKSRNELGEAVGDVYIYIFIYLLLFIFPYFRGNSLNSRAGLEFKELRLFPTIIFQKDVEFHFFLKNIVEKTKPIRI